MSKIVKDQRTIYPLLDETYLLTWLESFLIDRKAGGLADGTISFYHLKLSNFVQFCESQAITEITQITPSTIRLFLLQLEQDGHNAGGRHAHYRTLKTFLRWWEREIEPEGWKNPIIKVKAPKVSLEPLEPVDIGTIKRMIATCRAHSFFGARDRAIIFALMDTGVRASELLAMNLEDIDSSGAVLVRKGKGGKPRTVFFGRKTRKSIRSYYRQRKDDSLALWVNKQGDRLTYWGLRQIIRRRSENAGVQVPGLHDFRRYFALECLRSGKMSIYELQNLMGHADLQVLR